MTVKSAPNDLIVKEFSASKQAKLFHSLQQSQLSGQLIFTNPQQGYKWCFYLHLGQILYATGGVHPLRRWQRNVNIYLSQVSLDLKKEVAEQTIDISNSLWEYEQLSTWIEKQEITRQEANNLIQSIVQEILFDITQGMEVICKIYKNQSFTPQFDLIPPEQVINKTQKLWQNWQTAKIADRFPNMAPIILQAQQLEQSTSAHVYQKLCRLLDGKTTIRELAVELKTSPLQVVRSFLPYLQSGVLGLTEVPDLLESFSVSNLPNLNNSDRPLIACIDDSEIVSFTMEQILSISGYRFLAINEPLRAIPILIEQKPDFIFLDVVMPHINGYELCSQLRKHSAFAQTPIVFLTSNNGIINRFRARISGGSDFISKTVDAEKLLNLINKHLHS